MADAAVFWIGPVNLKQVSGATVPGAREVNLTCTGDGSGGTPVCGQLIESRRAGGRYLPQIIPGLRPDTDVFVGAFSAGGAAVKRMLLSSEEDRKQIRAVLLADATYADWAGNKPEVAEGTVLYALQAIDGPYLFLASASSAPNKTLPNGAQVLAAIREEIERRSGRKFKPFQVDGVYPPAVAGWKLGNVYLFDHQLNVSHGDHANKLAKQYWQAVLIPWLEGSARGGKLISFLALLAGGAGGYYAFKRLRKKG